ncbi:MAG: DUF3667 domain-containing protein [Idiomarina sp.]|nr:DUF3667 domain-containing protein [Idiomarina sp.]
MSESTMEVTPATCSNCHTPLQGPFCSACGQQDNQPIRNVFSLVGEFFGEMGNFDGRVWRTIVPLLLRPSYLTEAYVQGRRAPFVPPLRLYIFISVMALVVISTLLQQVGWTVNQGAFAVAQEGASGSQGNDLGIPGLASFVQNPRLFVSKFLSVAPQLMFLMLPMFALVLKLLYIRRQRFYMEHLILTLHTHAFMLLAILLILLLGLLNTGLETLFGEGFWLKPLSWLQSLTVLWIPVYLLLTQRGYYKQSWGKTFAKFLISSHVWMFLMIILVTSALFIAVITAEF